MTLKVQLLGAFLLVLAPLAMLETVEQTLAHQRRLSDSLATRVDSAEMVARSFRNLESGILGTETGIEEALNSYIVGARTASSYLHRARIQVPIVSQFLILDREGHPLAADPSHVAPNIRAAVATGITLAAVSGPGRDVQVLVARPWQLGAKRNGTVVAVLSGHRLDSWLRGLDPESRTLILSADGSVVVDTFFPVAALSRAPWLPVPPGASGAVQLPRVRDPRSGAEYLGASVPISRTPDWTSVSLRSREEALSSVRTATRRSVEIFALILMGSLLVAWLLGDRLSEPLNRLAEAASALGHGDLTRRLPEFKSLEYQAAASAFNEMADRLQAQTREREQLLQRTQEQAARMAALWRSSEALITPLDLHESTTAIAAQLRVLCPGEQVMIWAPARPNEPPHLLFAQEGAAPDRMLASQALTAAGVELRELGDGGGVLLVPLHWRDLQAAAVVHLAPGQSCDDEQLRLISIQSPLFAALLHNALRYEREQTLAEALQDWFTVPIPQTLGRLAIGYGFRPGQAEARLGGDLCDVFTVGGHAVLVVGDVCGKGLEAAVHALRVEHLVRAYATESLDPGELLGRLNRALAPLLPDNKFVTLHLDVLDMADLTLRYASAGHEGPLRVSQGRTDRLLAEGLLLGIDENATYQTHVVRLQPRDLLLWCTDGILEARSVGKELWGDDRLALAALETAGSSPTEVVDRVMRAAEAWIGAGEHDDMTLLAIEVQPEEAAMVPSHPPCAPEAVRA